jgi:hypothetical protein
MKDSARGRPVGKGWHGLSSPSGGVQEGQEVDPGHTPRPRHTCRSAWRRVGRASEADGMTVNEGDYPEQGTISVSWQVAMVDGRRRLGWTYASDPTLDASLAVALLRDVVSELEEDEPA